MGRGHEVLVAVENPVHAAQLVRTAADLARAHDGGVRIVSVVAKSRDSPFGVFSDEAIVREFSGERRTLLDQATAVAPDDVPVEGDLVVARSVVDGVLRAVRETDPAALLVGWESESRRTDAVIGTTVDALLRRAPCDVYVERIGRLANGVDAVLLPVVGGPHVRPAATVAAAVAAANDASVTVLSVATPSDRCSDEPSIASRLTTPSDRRCDDASDEPSVATRLTTPSDDRETAVDAVEAAREAVVDALGDASRSSVDVTAVVREADDVEDALVAAADEHDVLAFGATRHGTVRKRLVGSVPRRVADRTGRTVLLARAAEARGGRLRSLLGRLRGPG